MALEIDISIEAGGWSDYSDLDGVVRQAINTAAEMSGTDVEAGSEVSVLLTDDAAIQILNRDWRNMDKPTNVLSFPADIPEGLPGPVLLGDIAVAFETTRREAEAEQKSFPDHLTHLLVHGLLHLLDHDHDNDADATVMENLETRILARLGVADPYAGSEPEMMNR